jgi:hypothetical protein
MKKTTQLILVALLAAMMVSTADAATLSLVGSANDTNLNFSDLPSGFTTPTTTAKFGFGGGALLDFHLYPMASLEIGALYITRKTEINPVTITGSAVTDIVQKTNALQVPVVFRFWLHPMFSIGVGGYLAHGLSNVHVQDTNGNDISSTSYSGVLKQNDYGLVGVVGLRLPLGSMTRFMVDARYNYGLTNINDGLFTSGITENYRDLQILAGFSFPLGGNR